MLGRLQYSTSLVTLTLRSRIGTGQSLGVIPDISPYGCQAGARRVVSVVGITVLEALSEGENTQGAWGEVCELPFCCRFTFGCSDAYQFTSRKHFDYVPAILIAVETNRRHLASV